MAVNKSGPCHKLRGKRYATSERIALIQRRKKGLRGKTSYAP